MSDDLTLPPPRPLLPLDPDYPPGLRDLNPAPALRCAGASPPWRRCITLVGSRRASPEALDFARDLASDLAQADCTVVSGGALGVDGAAHEGALDAGGRTLVVLATGLRRAYPRAHHALFERAAGAGGALLTEARDDAVPQGFRFLHRNRLLAALGAATVVLEAPIRSGTLSTARHAKELGRPLFVVPSAPWEPRGAGGRALLTEGAKICNSAADVLSVFASGAPTSPSEAASAARIAQDLDPLGDDERLLYKALEGRARSLDELVKETGWSVSKVMRFLTTLEVAGRVEGRRGGRYGVARRRLRLH